jgi:hypothetical protein
VPVGPEQDGELGCDRWIIGDDQDPHGDTRGGAPAPLRRRRAAADAPPSALSLPPNRSRAR